MCAQRGGAHERTAALRTDELSAGCRGTLSSGPLGICALARRTFLRCRLSLRGGHHFLSSTEDESSVRQPPYANRLRAGDPVARVALNTPMNKWSRTMTQCVASQLALAAGD